jgi:hypothetical protein
MRYEILLDGESVRLTCAELQTLIELVLARVGLGNGNKHLDKTPICRLRKELIKGTGRTSAAALIETGGGEEYHLAIPRRDLKRRVRLTPCFFELVALGVITAEEAARLRKICGRAPRSLVDR